MTARYTIMANKTTLTLTAAVFMTTITVISVVLASLISDMVMVLP